MPTSKIAISPDAELLERVDRLVADKRFPSRSRAIQIAFKAQIDRLDRSLLARACAKADPDYEQALTEEGASYDLEQWPEY